MNRKALTLGELLIVVVIIIALAGLLIPAIVAARHASKMVEIPKALKEESSDRFQLSSSGKFAVGPPFNGADYCIMLDTNTGHKYIYFRLMGAYHFERVEDGGSNVQR